MNRTLKLFNTATRSRMDFLPENGKIGMYACGPTVYNFAHIGNLRTYIFEDVLVRTLRALGCEVRHVVNITDVGHLVSDEDTGEDKMEKGARREGKSVWDIAAFYADAFRADIRALNITEPSVWCRATDHISDMIALVKTLEEKGYTYQTKDGIYFDTAKFDRYCEFAGLDPDSLRAGSRVEMGEKRHATDFALWKFSPSEVKRQMEWESPWGTGFPGWHIECSAMAMKYLRLPLDIHCGGADHIRVHHSNEIAQSEAATGTPFARFWMHGEFLVMDQGKMAKSGGGFITLSRLREEGVPALAYRMFCFSAHYRSPLTFSWDGVRGAARSLASIQKQVSTLGIEESAGNAEIDNVLEPFWNALCDDLNMPKAMAAIWDMLKDSGVDPGVRLAAARRADAILGLDLGKNTEPREAYEDTDHGVIFLGNVPARESQRQELIEQIVRRKEARAQRNFEEADSIRNRLQARGIEIKDRKDGMCECILPANRT